MAWIKIIGYLDSGARLRALYDRIRGSEGNIDNIMQAHSLRPHTLSGHMAVYKNVMHHADNVLPVWLLETIGLYVSKLNGCDYCVQHHRAGLARLLQDEGRMMAIEHAMETGVYDTLFAAREAAALRYAEILTRRPARLSENDFDRLRAAGLDDGEILEINQVVSYFAYANRTVLGLGVGTEGERLGLSPGELDDPDNWQHR